MRLLPYIIAAGLFAGSARASDGPGSSGAEFLMIGAGARPAGMAETFTGLADDVHALYYNPAGLAFLKRKEAGLDHDAYADGVNHEWIGYAHPTAQGTFAGSANLLFIAPFESYDAVDNPAGKTSAADSAYQFGFATTVTENLALGASAKYVSSRLHETTARTFAGDAGALWRPLPHLSLGGSILNVGPGLRYISETADLPTTMRGGVAWTPFNPEDFRQTLTIAFDVEKRRDEGARISGGLEAGYDSVLALRVGGKTSQASGTGLTLGMGVYLFRDDTRGYEIDFDYAFAAAGDFTTSHRAGLVLKFGDPLTSAARAPVLYKSDVYYEDARRAKPRREKKAEPQAAPRKPRPSADPSIPDDFKWIDP